jgi:hypothetical protein
MTLVVLQNKNELPEVEGFKYKKRSTKTSGLSDCLGNTVVHGMPEPLIS